MIQQATSRQRYPQRIAGHFVWPAASGACRVLFVGKGPPGDRQSILRQIDDTAPGRVCWPHQIHSAIVRQADREGVCGEGDALVTESDSLALSVVTADCVPIVIEGDHHLAAIHAGWRGLAREIVPATLARIPGDRQKLRAWIGPSIGVCCYEVDWDVAHRVAKVSQPEVIRRHPDRPHLDLQAAARTQLQKNGVGSILCWDLCTHCSPEWLWSHRRDRPDDGRNSTFAWRTQGR